MTAGKQPGEQIVASRWFALFDLGCVFLGGAIWLRRLPPGGDPLGWFLPGLIALLPWAARLLSGRFPFKRTLFDLPLGLFLCMSAVGVWAAYDRPAAWAKFAMILAAVLVYYALAGQPKGNLWLVIELFSIFSGLLALYFLLVYDWQSVPVKVEFVNRIGAGWMALRPRLPLPPPDSDVTAGILAILTPLAAAALLRRAQPGPLKNRLVALLLGSTLLLSLAALFLAAERGPWLGLLSSEVVGLWWMVSRSLAMRRSPAAPPPPSAHRSLFLAGLAAALLVGLLAASLYPGGIPALADKLPGKAESESRVELWKNTLSLVGDFPLTGGGLESFSGLYSQYIKVIPYRYVENSHNFFLEIAIEQGIIGLLALGFVFVASLWLLAAALFTRGLEDGLSLLAGAALAGLLVLLVQGLIDNSLAGAQDIGFLFLLPGLAAACLPAPVWRLAHVGRKPVQAAVSGLALVALIGLFGVNRLAAVYYANLGAVKMARAQLAGFPANQWEDLQQVEAVAPSIVWFEKAVQYDSHNRTALHRLGLVALLGRDFPTAVSYLERAYRVDSQYRGIRKTLAYSEIWSQNLAQALPLLRQLPEAQGELEAYIGWWGSQDRSDLAALAEEASHALSGGTSLHIQGWNEPDLVIWENLSLGPGK